MYDRVRIDYTSDVSPEARESILTSIEAVARSWGLYAYPRYDGSCGAWSIDITAHDRSIKRALTDGQIVGYLESIAQEKGISVEALLREAATR